MSFFVFPNEFIYWEKINSEVHDDIKTRILPQILTFEEQKKSATPSGWNCNLSTSFQYECPFLIDSILIEQVIWGPLNRMLDAKERPLFAYPSSSQLTNIWYNIYQEGDFQEVHSHGDNQFSGIYLLDLPEQNTTTFYSASKRTGSTMIHKCDYTEEGTVILFPSDLSHYVNPVKTSKITLSFNIKSSYS